MDRVRFELDGEPVTVFSSEGIILDEPVSRATYRDEFLPAIFVDRQVLATCGTGCWGRFDVTLEYDVPAAQRGTLRAWDPSERDGRPENVREYPVYLRPTL